MGCLPREKVFLNLNLTPTFISNIKLAFKKKGAEWLTDLPRLLETAAQRWDLEIGEPFLLSYNYVCAARERKTGREVVLKIGVPNPELTSEITALDFYAGRGACQLLAADAKQGMLLLERLVPGTMLVTLENDDEATMIAAQVLRLIQHPAPQGKDFIQLRNWFNGLSELRTRFDGGTGPFPPKTVEIVENMIPEIFAEERPRVLLHGDFHHYNILKSERGWLVIDPKGVVGAPEYEIGPYLTNPIEDMPDEAEAIRRTQRRIAIFAEQLGFDRRRLLRWATCFSLLSSWWDVDENGNGGESSRAWTEIFLKTRV